jgi:hypothetical protein
MCQRVALAGCEFAYRTREVRDASRATFTQQGCALRGRAESHHSPVIRVFLSAHQSRDFECMYKTRHRGRLHLFRRGQFAECEWSTKDDDRERG